MRAISTFTYTKCIRCNKAKLFLPVPDKIFDNKKQSENEMTFL